MSRLSFDTWTTPDGTLGNPGGHIAYGPNSRLQGDPHDGNIEESYNVSSVTDAAAGNWAHTFINAAYSIDYVGGFGCGYGSGVRFIGLKWSGDIIPPAGCGWADRNTAGTEVDSTNTRVWTWGLLG